MTETPLKSDATVTAKYRFWLALFVLLLSALFAVLAFGAFAFAVEGGEEGEILPLFQLVGMAFMGLAIGCLPLAYKLRPGGE